MKPDKDVLDEGALDKREYERLQNLLDDSVRRFASHLNVPLGNVLRRQLAGAIAEDWSERAVKALNVLLDSEHSKLDEQSSAVFKELRNGLGERVSDTAVEREIEACCRALSHGVLARWYSILSEALETSVEVQLSPFMLPADFTIQKMLERVPFNSFDLEHDVVMGCFTAYQRQLATESKEKRRPIEIGSRIYIVHSYANQALPFLLLSDGKHATKLAKADPPAEPQHVRIKEAISEVSSLFGLTVEEPSPAALSFLTEIAYNSANVRRGIIPLKINIKSSAISAEFQERFGALVLQGLDYVCSYKASGNRSYETKLMKDALSVLAQEVRLPSDAMTMMYTCIVAAAAEGTKQLIVERIANARRRDIVLVKMTPEEVADSFDLQVNQNQRLVLKEALDSGFAFGASAIQEFYAAK